MAEIKLVLEGVMGGMLTTVTGTTKLSDALFVVADNIVFFGSIATDVLGNISQFISAVIEGFKGIEAGITSTAYAFLALLEGDFDRVKLIIDGTAEYIEQQFSRAFKEATEGLTDTGKMVRDAEKAVEKQQRLRAKLLAATGGGVGGAEGVDTAGTGTAVDFSKFVDGIQTLSAELDTTFDDLSKEFDSLIDTLEGLPRLMEQVFKVAIAGS